MKSTATDGPRRVSRTVKILVPVVIAAVSFGFAVGSFHIKRKMAARHTFHDMQVNHVTDFMSLVDPADPAVRSLASSLKTRENAYRWVRDQVVFDPTTAVCPPGEILQAGRASCLGKAILLCSLYRAQGLLSRNVRVVVGEVAMPRGALVEHAWLELEYNDVCLQQDPTNLLGVFEFNQFPGTSYADAFIRKESFCFNDHGFAVVSQLNRMRGNHTPGAP